MIWGNSVFQSKNEIQEGCEHDRSEHRYRERVDNKSIGVFHEQVEDDCVDKHGSHPVKEEMLTVRDADRIRSGRY